VARLIDESFEGTGYEESWTESVGTGDTVNEDSSGPGSLPSGAGTQCLRMTYGGSGGSQVARDLSSSRTTSYTRAYVYVTSVNVTLGSSINILTMQAGAGTRTATIEIINDAGILKFRAGIHTSAGWNYLTAASGFSLSTWYRLELKLDNSGGGSHEFLIDGSSIATLSGNLDRGAPSIWTIGDTIYSNARDMYFDLVAVDDATWVGTEATAAQSLVIPPRSAIQSMLAR
jgi:hypothetical protein